jgi:hypothetical protein
MFQPEPEQTIEQKRSRVVLWMGVTAAVLIIAVIVLLMRGRPEDEPIIENALRAGAAEFDAYKSKVEIEMIETIVHPNMVGMAQHDIRAKVHNRGDRALTGIEVLGKMIDLEDKVIKEEIRYPIPRTRQEPLKPGESMNFNVKIDRPGKVTEDMVKDHAIEVRGLRFE